MKLFITSRIVIIILLSAILKLSACKRNPKHGEVEHLSKPTDSINVTKYYFKDGDKMEFIYLISKGQPTVTNQSHKFIIN